MRKRVNLVMILSLAILQISIAQCIKGDCYNGRGTFMYTSGAKYTGEFSKGKIHGQGMLKFSNGNIYVGDWKNHYREGKGKLTYANGDVYKGEFKQSKFNGKGTMTFRNGEEYIGEWANDLQNGKGKYSYSNGDHFEGSFYNGAVNGEGTMHYANGGKYVGSWKNNKKDGQGTFVDESGEKLSGLWVSGKLMNQGQQTASEEVLVNNSSDVEIDQIKNNIRDCNREYCTDGFGKYVYSDGSTFVGKFHNGYPANHGTCYYANGDKYVGGWKQHAPHGEGIMSYSNGRVLGAMWEFGNPKEKLDNTEQYVSKEKIKVDVDDDVKIWSVIIGVGRYTHMPVLKYTDDDAYQIYAFLKSPEGGALPDNQIKVLIDEDASRTNIIRAMRQVFLQADENDVVMLYFSGHGLPGSFLPVDFDGFNNKLHHDDITDILNESRAKHKLCLADACHSGTMTAARSIMDNSLKQFYDAFEKSSGGTALLLSSKGDEFSLEDHGLRQGIFSHYLIRGLKGEADRNNNRIVSVTELFDFVYTNVRSYTANAQSPRLTGKFDKDMPIAVIR